MDDSSKTKDELLSEIKELKLKVKELKKLGPPLKKTGKALEFQRDQLLSIFDSIDEIIYVSDPYTNEILYINSFFKKIIGKDVLGKKCHQEFQGFNEPCSFCTNKLILKQKPDPYRWEYYNPQLEKHVDIIDRIIKWPDGRDVRLEIAIDITDRKKMENELQRKKQQLNAVIEGNPIPQFVINKKHEVIYWNQALREYSGLESEEIIGSNKHWKAFYTSPRPCLADLVVDGDYESLNKWYPEKYSTSKHVPGAFEAEDFFPHLGKKGKWLYFTAAAIKNPSGEVIGAVETLEDITRSKKAEKALRENEEKYRNLVELLPQSIFEVDTLGNITFFNSFALKSINYTSEDVKKGLNVLQIIAPEDHNKLQENMAKTLSGQKLKGIEYTILRKNKSKFPAIIYGDVIIHNNRPTGIRGIAIDITGLKKAQNEIKTSLKEKEKLLQEIHHRVKNNMQIITSLLNLQSYELSEPEALKMNQDSQSRVKALAMIHEKLYESTDLVNVPLKSYIEGLVFYLYDAYGIDQDLVKKELKIEDIKLNIDTAIPLGLIINETVSNSLKHAFPHGRKGVLKIDFHEQDDKYLLKVCDDGIGLPLDIDPLHSKTLGLKLIYSLVNQLDGNLNILREPGTSFKIEFKELEYQPRI